jgi:AcrR family transcriptional regulator
VTRTQRQRQGENSREQILDATERLMSTRGYSATSISDIRAACGLPASSIYWHFGSKEGVLAAVMERGADRFFAQIPRRDADVEARRAAAAGLHAQHPEFLRLFYLLALERSGDATVAEVIRRVRDTAIADFREAITLLLPADAAPDRAERIVDELTAVAVALSDGIFFAAHLEPDATDVDRMFTRLFQVVSALLPILLEEK